MILMDGAQQARQLTHWPFQHSCEWMALSEDTGGSQYSKRLFWLSRMLVSETHEAAEWVYDRLDLLSLLGDGPAKRLAEQWVRNSEAQRRAYNRIYSGRGFAFRAWDGEGLTYLLTVTPIPAHRKSELVRSLGLQGNGDT